MVHCVPHLVLNDVYTVTPRRSSHSLHGLCRPINSSGQQSGSCPSTSESSRKHEFGAAIVVGHEFFMHDLLRARFIRTSAGTPEG